jgi:hypothetical protein
MKPARHPLPVGRPASCRRPAIHVVAAGLFGATLIAGTAAAQPRPPAPPAGWPDRPLVGWTRPGEAVPRAEPAAPPELATRCPPLEAPSSAAAQALTAAGWLPFYYFDRALVAGDVEILAGMTDGDPICRPMRYNLFVFVGGRFAGTLSPLPMNSRADLSSGMVRLLPDDAVSVEVTRYGPDDPPCCPSSRDTVRFTIDRTQTAPVVRPTDVRRTRGGK